MSASINLHAPFDADTRPSFRVAAFGLGLTFQRIVEIVCRLSRDNPYRFVFAPTDSPADYDLALVDMTVADGQAVARVLGRLAPAAKGVTVVTVGRRSDPTRACDDLVLQRFSVNLLAALNQAVERQMLGPLRRGARFFRSDPPNGAHASKVRTAQPLAGAPSRRQRVLVIDGSPVLRRQVSMSIEAIGLDVEGVGTAREGLALLALRRYELAILDVDLRDVDGFRVIRQIRRGRGLARVPVIVLTRRSSAFDLLRGMVSGCDGYLVKPTSQRTLRDSVLRCIRPSPDANDVAGGLVGLN
jgi:twitching motility two-component system response regulator PilG